MTYGNRKETLMSWTKEDITSITFLLENHDTVQAPATCFNSLSITPTKKGLEMEAHLIDDGAITGEWTPLQSSPLQRLNARKDIEAVDVELTTGETFCGDVVWESHTGATNHCIITNLENYRSCTLSINAKNIRYRLEQVLNLPVGTTVVDETGKSYQLSEKGACVYLKGGIVCAQLLNQTFTIK